MAATGQEMAREKRVGKMKFKITYLFFSLHFYCFLTFKILLYINFYGHESHIYIRINFYFSIFFATLCFEELSNHVHCMLLSENIRKWVERMALRLEG